MPTAEDVRPRLNAVLDQLRMADSMPLSEADQRFWRTVAPQMSRWLPADEREAYLASFEREMDRLTRRAA